jgi:hypothetical protein
VTPRRSRATFIRVTVIPEQRQAQERLWRALTKLDAIDQPGADRDVDRGAVEEELFQAWADYELARSLRTA